MTLSYKSIYALIVGAIILAATLQGYDVEACKGDSACLAAHGIK